MVIERSSRSTKDDRPQGRGHTKRELHQHQCRGHAGPANADGSDTLTVMAQNLSLGGSILTLSSGAGFASAMSAQGLIATLDSSISNISVAMARLGASSRALDRHTTFIGKLQDTLEVNVGRLVDADMAKESSKLQALQLKQQLAIQTLSVANRSQSFLLQLFGR